MDRTQRAQAIGGFLGLELPEAVGGLRRLWGVRDEHFAFENARSALAGLISAQEEGTVWFPAYICPELVASAPGDRRRYYPLDTCLSPRVDFLQEMVRAGDLLLVVDFFGRPPGQSFLDYVSAHHDVLFIEDCAQALDTGRPPWGDWRLFSPRKLVGVPDGGLLVPASAKAAAVLPAASVRDGLDAVELARPQLARFEDEEEGAHNQVWHQLNQTKEAALPISNRRISRLGWAILGLLDANAIADRRRRNFATLAALLPQWAFLPEQRPRFVPLGFPVRLAPEQRARVRDHLNRQRVFAAVHWPNLPSPADEFPAEHALSDSLLTLPCDQRYGDAEMHHVAETFLDAAS
jgi:dTDP-4-amino-4,6-dideoxygalactose transaminase